MQKEISDNISKNQRIILIKEKGSNFEFEEITLFLYRGTLVDATPTIKSL